MQYSGVARDYSEGKRVSDEVVLLTNSHWPNIKDTTKI